MPESKMSKQGERKDADKGCPGGAAADWLMGPIPMQQWSKCISNSDRVVRCQGPVRLLMSITYLLDPLVLSKP